MNTAVSLESHQVLPELQYRIVSEYLYKFELGEYFTYGIQTVTPEHTDILHDVSVCNKTTEQLVKLLIRYQVSPVHLYDVVTDLLP